MTPAPSGPGLLIPRVSLAGARAAYVGPGLELAPHRNAAATLAVGLEAPFALGGPVDRGDPGARWVALIPPGTRHHLHARGPMAFLYLDAVSDDHACLRALDLDDAGARLRAALAETGDGWEVGGLAAALGLPARPCPGAPVLAAIRRLEADPRAYPRVGDLAAEAGLSPSRFQALFKQATGVPFRRYRLWRRMASVVLALQAGATLTEAAFLAGFSSSAHLSATFRDLFGLTPSSLRARGLRVTATGAAMEPR